MTTDERMQEALRMKAEGKTFKDIGDAFGVSRERARQIYTKARRLERVGTKWTDGLPAITANTLRSMGFTSRDDVARAVEGKTTLKEKSIIFPVDVGIGKQGMKKLKAWLTNNSTPSASSD